MNDEKECFDMTGGRGLHALHCALFSESWRDAGQVVACGAGDR